jgi:hypothetical protein
MDAIYRENVFFQIDQGGGYWQTVTTSSNVTGQVVSWKLQDLKKSWPNHRVRAITHVGRLIDII